LIGNRDSYWIVRGLLAGNMAVSAQQLVGNLLDMVDRYIHSHLWLEWMHRPLLNPLLSSFPFLYQR